ncbi:hypothetical protein LBMAG42_30060 [Deltaproteobacteria bacterium]|nr:hypothetical protein LBMAG42_30060 [Deltaproteobacteria bacterium]
MQPTPKLLFAAVLLLASACAVDEEKSGKIPVDTATDDSGDTGSVKPPEIILGDPYVVMVAATAPGSLGSTCDMELALSDVAGVEAGVNLSLNGKGCDWIGAGLKGGTQYRGTFDATGCKSGNEEHHDVQTFSGQEGFLFAMWYTGVNIGYDQLEQGTEQGDFLGGQAHVTVANSFPDSNVQAIANGMGTTATLESTAAAGNVYLIEWESELNVGEVLSAYTAEAGDDFVSAEPTWISKPSWWPKCG